MGQRGTWLLGLAAFVALAAAIPATFPDPPGNDLLLHGHMVAGAAEALTEQGWAAFQDPWIPGPNWGYPLLHAYPHLAHQTAGLLAAAGIEPYQASAALLALLALLLPVACYTGGRWLGLTPERAGLAALAAASLRCLDVYGHTPLSYSFEGAGLLAQAMGGVLAALAIPALVAAGEAPRGSPLAGLSRGRRIALAGVLLSLTLRAHLVAGWIAPLAALLLLVARRDGWRRLGGLVAAGVLAAGLSAGFLIPFFGDLSAVNDSAMEAGGRSYGLLRVLAGLLGGEQLDGGTPGAWTLALALAVVGVRRAKAELARPLAWGLLAMVLLMAGRATWGEWMNALPLVGRFHDQRYLLGIHLLVPWLIGGAGPDGLLWLRGKAGRAALWVETAAVFALGLGTVSAVLAGAEQLKTARAAQEELAAWRPLIDGVVEEARTLGGPVVATFPDALIASTTPMSWLRRQGVPTVGKPLQHYSHGYELGVWLAEHKELDALLRAGPALGLVGLVHERRDPASPPSYRLERIDRPFPDLSLVRADLLMRSEGPSLDGVALAFWQSGAWLAGQHPALALSGRSVGGSFLREGRIERPDAAVLDGLPGLTRGGAILEADPPLRGVGARRVRLRADEEGLWLKVGQSWHPGLAVTVDGAQAEPVLLLPGQLGVRVPRGEHEVAVAWAPAPWRGPWAALNLLLVLGLLGWVRSGPRRPEAAVSLPVS